jgi:predicted O-methyltransferase YrrM
MQKLIFILTFCLSVLSFHSSLSAKDYLANRISPTDPRAPSFQMCFQILEARQAKVLVETGTARNGSQNCAGDGCSTVLFADWAKDHHATLYSVDICPQAIKTSKKAVRHINRNVQFFTQDSVGFLQNFGRQIDFLYLDSYDFDFANPDPSQIHHLHEIEAALPYLHKDSVIMIDDCALPYGGKGKLVIEYLTSLGWKILLESYQTILVYPDSSNH